MAFTDETRVDKQLYIWLGVFLLGFMGVHRFMRGQIFWGICMLLTVGLLGVWQLIDFIIALSKMGRYEKDFIFYNGEWAK